MYKKTAWRFICLIAILFISCNDLSISGALDAELDYLVGDIVLTSNRLYTGNAVSGTFTVTNTVKAEGSSHIEWNVYASSDDVTDSTDLLISSGTGPVLGKEESVVLSFAGTWPDEPGSYYLIVQISSKNEKNPENNISVNGPHDIRSLDIDYAFAYIEGGSEEFVYTSLNARISITNEGTDAGTQGVYWHAYISGDAVYDTDDTHVSSGSVAALAPGAVSSPVIVPGIWAVDPGNWYLIFRLEARDENENSRGNNIAVSDMYTLVQLDVDYGVSSIQLQDGAQAKSGEDIAIEFTLTNHGRTQGMYNIDWTAWLSADGTERTTQIASGSRGPLSGQTEALIEFTSPVLWPVVPEPANRYIIVEIESDDDMQSTGNNSGSSVFAVEPFNVMYSAAMADSTVYLVESGTEVAESFVILNIGDDTGNMPVSWHAYISSDNIIDGNYGTPVASGTVSDTLESGESRTVIIDSGIWPDITAVPGSRYIVITLEAADNRNTVTDFASAAFTVSPLDIDYTVSTTPAGVSAYRGDAINMAFNVQNIGTVHGTTGANSIGWYAYYSVNGTDYTEGSHFQSGSLNALNAGQTAPVQVTGNWNPGQGGTWHILLRIVAADDRNTANNTGASGVCTITSRNIDYQINAFGGGTVSSGSVVNAGFTLRNTGSAAGVADVSWQAYLSIDSILDGSYGTLLDEGILPGGLAAGGSSALVLNSGNWPIITGSAATRYLIITVSANDDINPANNARASAAFTVTPLNIDYTVDSVPAGRPVYIGDDIEELFTIENIGSDNGTAAVDWEAFISLNQTIDAGDLSIAEGTIPALASDDIPFEVSLDSGVWDTGPGNRYLLFRISAQDDSIPGNNTGASGIYTLTYRPDYTIASPSFDLPVFGGNTGEALSSAGTVSSFIIQNQGLMPGTGTGTISWHAYFSTSGTASGTPFSSGSLPGFANSSSSSPRTVIGNLPSVPGAYFIVLSVNADDDTGTLNNSWVSEDPVHVWNTTGNVESTADNEIFNNAEDFFVLLNSSDSVQISGRKDGGVLRDLYRLRTGTGVTQVTITLTWSTAANDLDMQFYNSNRISLAVSRSNAHDTETYTLSGMGANSAFYIAVESINSNNANAPYQLVVTAP